MVPEGQGGFQSVKSAKGRSGYRVQSLPEGHGRQRALFHTNTLSVFVAIQSVEYPMSLFYGLPSSAKQFLRDPDIYPRRYIAQAGYYLTMLVAPQSAHLILL